MKCRFLSIIMITAACLMTACPAPKIQMVNREVASSYAAPEALYFDASVNGNIIIVMRLIEEKFVDVNTRDRFGWTGCMYAARYGYEGLFEYFLSRKIDIDQAEDKGQTLLMIAVSARNYEIVRLLMEAGADPTIQDKEGYTALMWAIFDRSWDGIPLLLATGKGINIRNTDGETALHMVISAGRMDLIPLFINHGADLNIMDKSGTTTLMIAAKAGNEDMIRYLVEMGADMNLKNGEGKTALDIARSTNHLKIVAFLENRMKPR
ncbi:MAG: ankyrin repeat domain-containing protein [Syntrophales bacterium]|nr:ankyrin repeat domain-containing protein [Syntrophales bacterium]